MESLQRRYGGQETQSGPGGVELRRRKHVPAARGALFRLREHGRRGLGFWGGGGVELRTQGPGWGLNKGRRPTWACVPGLEGRRDPRRGSRLRLRGGGRRIWQVGQAGQRGAGDARRGQLAGGSDGRGRAVRRCGATQLSGEGAGAELGRWRARRGSGGEAGRGERGRSGLGLLGWAGVLGYFPFLFLFLFYF